MNLLSKLFLLFTAFLCVSFQTDTCSSIDKKSKEIIEAYLTKIGGKPALRNIHSIKFVVEFESKKGEKGSMTMCAEKPGHIITTTKTGTDVIVSAYTDGVYQQYINGKSTTMSPTEREMLMRNLYIFPMAYLDSLNVTAEYRPNSKFLGISCNGVAITYAFGMELCYFSKKNSLLLGISRGGHKNYYSDYRKVGDVLYPFKITITTPENYTIVYKVISVEFNKDYPDEDFNVK